MRWQRSGVAALLAGVVAMLAATVGVASTRVHVPPHSPGAVAMPVADLVAAQMPIAPQAPGSRFSTQQGEERVPGLVISPESKTKKGWAFCRVKGAKMKAFYCPVFPANAPLAVQMGWFDVVECAVALGTFIVGNAVAISKIRKAGGVWKFAKGLKRKKGESKKKHKDRVLTSLGVLMADLTGATAVVEKCGGA